MDDNVEDWTDGEFVEFLKTANPDIMERLLNGMVANELKFNGEYLGHLAASTSARKEIAVELLAARGVWIAAEDYAKAHEHHVQFSAFPGEMVIESTIAVAPQS